MDLKRRRLISSKALVLMATLWIPTIFAQLDDEANSTLLYKRGDRPITKEGCSSDDYFFPDYEKCGIYYRCYPNGLGKWGRESFECPEGQSFSEELQRCENVPCAVREAWPEVPANLPCKANSHYRKYQYPGDCRKFYLCIWTGNYFTYKLGRCTNSWFSEKYQNCRGLLYCPQEAVLRPPEWECGRSPKIPHPHPEDCTKYYFCYKCDNPTGAGKARCVQEFQCPEGEKFNPDADEFCAPGTCENKQLHNILLPPDWDCCGENQYNVHPLNCSMYYRCRKCDEEEGWCYDNFERCPPGQFYDNTDKACVEANMCPQDLLILPPEPGWICEADGEIHAMPNDCSQYYTCRKCSQPGKWCYEPTQCPIGQLYDEVDKQCVTSIICPQHWVELPEGEGWDCEIEDERNVVPEVCTDYYFCLPCNRPGDWCYLRHQCPEGFTFDDMYKRCVPGRCPQDPVPIPDIFNCTDDGEIHVHPLDCSRFYKCVWVEKFGYFTWNDEECDGDTNFDEHILECVEGICPQALKEADEESGTSCSEQDEEHVFPGDCSRFYVCHKCSKGSGWCYDDQQCPAGQTYDEDEKTCVSGRCAQLPPKIPAEWTCTEDGEKNVVPDDCSSYYTCIACEDGPWCYTEIEACPDGETFDNTNKECVEGRCKQFPEILPPTWACGVEGEKNVLPSDCSKYYTCIICPDMADTTCYTVESCGEGETYDDAQKLCVAGRCPQYPPILPEGWNCTTDNELHVSPDDCGQYYSCMKNCPDADWCHVPRSCPNDTKFDEYSKSCVPGICPQDRPELSEGLECNAEEENNMYPSDCQSYYTCYRCSKPRGWCYEKNSCPTGYTFYDEKDQCVKKRCRQWPDKLPKDWTCRVEGGLMPHPNDCTSYYKCIGCPDGGWCYELITCPDGHKFNQVRKACVTGNCGKKEMIYDYETGAFVWVYVK